MCQVLNWIRWQVHGPFSCPPWDSRGPAITWFYRQMFRFGFHIARAQATAYLNHKQGFLWALAYPSLSVPARWLAALSPRRPLHAGGGFAPPSTAPTAAPFLVPLPICRGSVQDLGSHRPPLGSSPEPEGSPNPSAPVPGTLLTAAHLQLRQGLDRALL